MSLRTLFSRKEKPMPEPAPPEAVVVTDHPPVHDEVAITNEQPATVEQAPPAPPVVNEFGWTAKAADLRALRRLAGTIVDEALIHVEDGGLRLAIVDPAHVCMMTARMACPTTGTGYFTVRVADWLFLEKATGPLLVKTRQEGGEGGSDVATFTLPAEGHTVKVRNMTPRGDGKGPSTPRLNFTATVLVPAARLKRLVGMAKGGQVLRVDVEGDVATFQVDEEDSVRAPGRRRRRSTESKARRVPETTLRINEKETPGYIVKAEGKTHSLFSLDYFSILVQAAHKDAMLTFDLGSDWPTRIRWNDGPLQVEALLAPRIES